MYIHVYVLQRYHVLCSQNKRVVFCRIYQSVCVPVYPMLIVIRSGSKPNDLQVTSVFFYYDHQTYRDANLTHTKRWPSICVKSI